MPSFVQKFLANKTNGICHRQFQPGKYRYALFLRLLVPAGFDDANELKKLSALEQMPRVLDKMDAAKREEKSVFAAYVKKTTGVEMIPPSLIAAGKTLPCI